MEKPEETNRNFVAHRTGSALSALYGSSIMENHHFYHCQLLLEAEVRSLENALKLDDIVHAQGNNILTNLTESEHQQVIEIVKNCILSTDLEQYFK